MLEVLQNRVPADAGKIKWGASLTIGYYDQKLDQFDPEKTVLEEAAADRVGITIKEVRDVLAMMLFRDEDSNKQIKLLSGGERARVRLAQLLLDKPNVLILDEPTNHLDVDSATALEGALNDFPGTIFFVSHDRYFLDKVASRLLVIDPPNMKDFEGGYSDWQAKKSQIASEAAAANSVKNRQQQKSSSPQQKKEQPKPHQSNKKDNPYARPFGRLTVGDLEKQIAESERSVADFQMKLADPKLGRDPAKGKKLKVDHDAMAAKLKQLEAEYYAREQ
jgi:ATP-binding cassette, subfamily F, member 3